VADNDPPDFTPFPLNPLERIFHQQNENTKALRSIVADTWRRQGETAKALNAIRGDLQALAKEVAILAAAQNVTNLNLATLGSVDRTVREIHLAVSKTEIYVGETRRGIDQVQGKIDKIDDDITGSHRIPTAAELNEKPENVIAAVLLLIRRVPSWVQWVVGLGTSGTIAHILTRYFHHG
jgi:hypothetical protein